MADLNVLGTIKYLTPVPPGRDTENTEEDSVLRNSDALDDLDSAYMDRSPKSAAKSEKQKGGGRFRRY